MSVTELVLDCPGCGSRSRFETPDCPDHGAACPELACVLCGWGLVLEAVDVGSGRGATWSAPRSA